MYPTNKKPTPPSIKQSNDHQQEPPAVPKIFLDNQDTDDDDSYVSIHSMNATMVHDSQDETKKIHG